MQIRYGKNMYPLFVRAAVAIFVLSLFLSAPALAAAKKKPATPSQEQPASSAAGSSKEQPAALEEEPITFSPIMVTATRVEADLHGIPMSVSVVGEKSIEEKPGATAAEHFVDVPGVSYTSGKGGPGNNAMISIRGLEAGRVLYLIDGVRQNSIFKEDMNKGLMNVDPDDIERIEVIKGPASSLYGSDAIGGVVNIITKKGGKGKPIGGKISGVYDSSNNLVEPRLSAYGDYNGFSYRISGNLGFANDRRLEDRDTADHTSYTTQSLSGQLGYAWDKGSINFTAQHYDSDVEEMTAVYNFTDKRIKLYDKHDPRVTALSDFPRNQRDTYTGTLSLKDLSDNLKEIKTIGFYQFRDTIQRGENTNGYTGNASKLQDLSGLYGATLQTSWSFFDSHAITMGMDYTHEDLRNKSYVEYSSPLTYEYKGFQDSIAIFLQDEWSITKDLKLTAGLRQSWINTKLTKNEKDPTFTGSDEQANLSGNVGLVYTGFDKFALRAQYSQGFRTPDLGSQFTGAGIYLLPNRSLKPEKSNNYETGVRYTDNNLTLDASIFYNKIDDVLTTKNLYYIPGTVWSVNTTVNAATYTSYGFEMAAAWNIPDTDFTPYGNITMLRTEMDHGWYTTRYNRVPETWGTLGLKWDKRFDKSLRAFADLSGRMSAGYKQDGGSNEVWFTHKAGETLDFTTGMELGSEEKFKAALSLKNLLNKPYEPAYYYYPGFHAVLSLSYEF